MRTWSWGPEGRKDNSENPHHEQDHGHDRVDDGRDKGAKEDPNKRDTSTDDTKGNSPLSAAAKFFGGAADNIVLAPAILEDVDTIDENDEARQAECGPHAGSEIGVLADTYFESRAEVVHEDEEGTKEGSPDKEVEVCVQHAIGRSNSQQVIGVHDSGHHRR